ncbi:MAG TPA: nucleotidyltransferase family protein [Xanthomonadales bacterium]|nr:nucleotidyltransferase family protein [Xanthomonadales bacterium]
MRAMILAAGRGERLRPLTDERPKPLLDVGGRPLIEYHLEHLANAGFHDIVINQGHMGDLLRQVIGDGERWRVRIHWSNEQPRALETGGGIFQALPMLGPAPFLVINGDVWTDYPLSRLRAVKCDWAHLVLIRNPDHNPGGDFSLHGARLSNTGEALHTFAGIGVYHSRLFSHCSPGKFSVVPLLRAAIDEHLVSGELYCGAWADIGNLERLEAVRSSIAQAGSTPSAG